MAVTARTVHHRRRQCQTPTALQIAIAAMVDTKSRWRKSDVSLPLGPVLKREAWAVAIAESATAIGVILHGVLAVSVFLFWRQAHGKSQNVPLRRSADQRHRVHRVLATHPGGGTRFEYSQWMRQET
jgi:hypothetical protein